MKPYIVQAITDQNGGLVETFGPQTIRRAVSPATARTMARIMQTVIAKGGTGINAALEGYSAGGKTGTAQKIDEQGEYTNEKYTASFVGFAPAEKPKVAILVVIDEPSKGHYGGVVAAPAFRKIANKTLNYLNIPPENKTDKLTASFENEA
jgi:cell division protein FtsI (penicillin-binding protein 3)